MGCYEELKPKLSNLLKYLVNELSCKNKFVRSIACWSISCFVKFLFNDNINPQSREFLSYTINEVISKLKDKEYLVRKAACNTIITMIEENKTAMTGFIGVLIENITEIFNLYELDFISFVIELIERVISNYSLYLKQNTEILEPLISLIVNRWLHIVKMIKKHYSKLINIFISFANDSNDWSMSNNLFNSSNSINKNNKNLKNLNYNINTLTNDCSNRSINNPKPFIQCLFEYFKKGSKSIEVKICKKMKKNLCIFLLIRLIIETNSEVVNKFIEPTFNESIEVAKILQYYYILSKEKYDSLKSTAELEYSKNNTNFCNNNTNYSRYNNFPPESSNNKDIEFLLVFEISNKILNSILKQSLDIIYSCLLCFPKYTAKLCLSANIFQLIFATMNNNSLKHYCIALLSTLIEIDYAEVSLNLEFIVECLINYIDASMSICFSNDTYENKEELMIEKIDNEDGNGNSNYSNDKLDCNGNKIDYVERNYTVNKINSFNNKNKNSNISNNNLNSNNNNSDSSEEKRITTNELNYFNINVSSNTNANTNIKNYNYNNNSVKSYYNNNNYSYKFNNNTNNNTNNSNSNGNNNNNNNMSIDEDFIELDKMIGQSNSIQPSNNDSNSKSFNYKSNLYQSFNILFKENSGNKKLMKLSGNKNLTDLLKNYKKEKENSEQKQQNFSICNNSICAISNLILKHAYLLNPELVELIISRAILILNNKSRRLEICLAQNVSILIGRIAFKYPKIMSNFLGGSLKNICQTLRGLPNSSDKQIAFSGICNSVIFNPSQAVNSLIFFFDALVCYYDAPDSLSSLFSSVIFSFKRYLSVNWKAIYSTFPEKLKLMMQARFLISDC